MTTGFRRDRFIIVIGTGRFNSQITEHGRGRSALERVTVD